MNAGYDIPPALFAGTDRYFLPVFNLLIQSFTFQADFTAFTPQWRDVTDAQLGGFLNGEVHAVAFRNHLTEMKLQWQWRIFPHDTGDISGSGFLTAVTQGRGVFTAVTIKQPQCVAIGQAQHAHQVSRSLAVELQTRSRC